ncbi:MAG: POTRA domain-containing protein [Candidatus Acidiferrales bacterium]
MNQDYSADDVEAFVRLSLLTLYENRGYLRANFGEPQAQLRKTDNRVPDGVSVTLPVREGFAYVWNGVEWSGNRVLSTTDLNKFLDMRAGEIANAQKIDDGLRIVRDAYMSRGFIQMKLGTQKKLNDSVKFATYSLTIDEGSQFHMGTFSVTGLPGSLTKHLLKEWKIKPGEVFDQTYVTKFLKDKAAPAIYQSGSRGWNSSVKIQQDATAQTVNVQIAFNQ